MIDEQMRKFAEGLLIALSVEASVAVDVIEGGAECRVDRPTGELPIYIRRNRQQFGIIWEIWEEGGHRRAHPSAQGAIRSIGALLAPERPRGRVLFAESIRT
jgi:hypothetical protein